MDYSARWRQTFGEVDPARTARELAFLTRVLPLPEFGCVLDVPCGNGRHMHGMAAAGYKCEESIWTLAASRRRGLAQRPVTCARSTGSPARSTP